MLIAVGPDTTSRSAPSRVLLLSYCHRTLHHKAVINTQAAYVGLSVGQYPRCVFHPMSTRVPPRRLNLMSRDPLVNCRVDMTMLLRAQPLECVLLHTSISGWLRVRTLQPGGSKMFLAHKGNSLL
jgi:hypothetical protein